eukprot:CAMPEP_0115849956 /NCGR_PEP_ID=MMETSP0287-20121206/11717_1 /TAXON_ID=412157 /ORGANISM="Chrysochromulina rotalis, Strain UIO044" /LENGTH=226 /DNA_ID=CAMNT_0003303941 /DNA_START=113 /DNA_END=795 /DNA_ORIENTATION=+
MSGKNRDDVADCDNLCLDLVCGVLCGVGLRLCAIPRQIPRAGFPAWRVAAWRGSRVPRPALRQSERAARSSITIICLNRQKKRRLGQRRACPRGHTLTPQCTEGTARRRPQGTGDDGLMHPSVAATAHRNSLKNRPHRRAGRLSPPPTARLFASKPPSGGALTGAAAPHAQPMRTCNPHRRHTWYTARLPQTTLQLLSARRNSTLVRAIMGMSSSILPRRSASPHG